MVIEHGGQAHNWWPLDIGRGAALVSLCRNCAPIAALGSVPATRCVRGREDETSLDLSQTQELALDGADSFGSIAGAIVIVASSAGVSGAARETWRKVLATEVNNCDTRTGKDEATWLLG